MYFAFKNITSSINCSIILINTDKNYLWDPIKHTIPHNFRNHQSKYFIFKGETELQEFKWLDKENQLVSPKIGINQMCTLRLMQYFISTFYKVEKGQPETQAIISSSNSALVRSIRFLQKYYMQCTLLGDKVSY